MHSSPLAVRNARILAGYIGKTMNYIKSVVVLNVSLYDCLEVSEFILDAGFCWDIEQSILLHHICFQILILATQGNLAHPNVDC